MTSEAWAGGPPSTEEQPVIHETENILNHVIEVRERDRQIGDFLVDSLLSDRNGLVMMGEPGNGKTTITTQLKEAVERTALERGMQVDVVISRYDEYLARAEAYLGSRELWTPLDWRELNDFIFEEYISSIADDKKEDQVRKVRILELPAVGSNEERDRGVRASRLLFERAESQDKPDSLFVFITNNNLVQQRASFLRRAILDPELADRDVVALLAAHNQNVPGEYDDEEKGRRVKAIFAKSALPYHMTTIRKEEAEEIALWEEDYIKRHLNEAIRKNPDASRDAHDYDIMAQRMIGMRLPDGLTDEKVREVYARYQAHVDDSFIQQKASTIIDATMRQAVYAEQLLHYTYRLDHDTAFVVHNPYDSASTISINIDDGFTKAA